MAGDTPQTEIDAVLAAVMRGAAVEWPARLDPALGVERILYHGIAGLIVEQARAVANWPAAVTEPVRGQAIAQAMWEIRHKARLTALLAAFAGAGMTALLLKGSALAYDLYSAPGARARGDSDVLVAAADLAGARRILGQLGFARDPEPAVADDLALQEVWSAPDGTNWHHIDLHWQLLNAPALAGVLPFDRCAAGAIALPRLGPGAMAMAHVATLLHTCIHRAMHISDLRGCLPLFESHIPAIIDARTRLLAPGGRMIPARDRLRIALCSHAPSQELRDSPWLENDYGLDLSAGHRFAANHWHKVELGAGDLRSAPQDLALLDYRTISDPNVAAKVTLHADQPGTVDGFAIWFDAELGDGIGFTNAPGEPLLVYGQTFFPLEQSVALGKGDRIEFAFRADLINDSYVYSWDSIVNSGGGERHFRQSSFKSRLIPLAQLAAQSSDFVPAVEDRHAVDRFCLGLIDGQRSLGAIGAEAMANYPTAFATATKALDHVAKLAQRYHSPRPTRKDAQ